MSVAGVLWLLVNGYCAAQLLGAGASGGSALLVMDLPLLAVLGWYLVLRHIPSRSMGASGLREADDGLKACLVILAVVLGIAAVWTGEAHVRGIRIAINEMASLPSADAASGGTMRRLIESYHTLAIAGGLLQLAVVTLGAGLSRDGRSGEEPSATTTER